jgi:DNA-binding MarR family transcriptional regulator
MVNGLEERGLLVRRRNREDGRRSDLALTSAGTAYLRRANERCQTALAVLADTAAGAKDPPLVSSLQRWLLALDVAAVELRSLIDASESA